MHELNMMPHPPIEIPMDPHLLFALNLSSAQGFENGQDTNIDPEPAEDGNKISSLLKAALSVSEYHFPLLNESAWQVLLNLFQPNPLQPRELVMKQMAKSDFVSNLLADVRIDHSEEDQKAVDFDRLENLDMAECFAIMLVADRFWSLERNTVTTLRSILSKVSGRPEECVFSNDHSA